MKMMTCRQLAGACDLEFKAETFEEMAEMSKAHAMEMFKKNDAGHLKAMADMKELMKTPGASEAWFAKVRKEFDDLPEL